MNEMQIKMPNVSGSGRIITKTNLHVSNNMFIEIWTPLIVPRISSSTPWSIWLTLKSAIHKPDQNRHYIQFIQMARCDYQSTESCCSNACHQQYDGRVQIIGMIRVIRWNLGRIPVSERIVNGGIDDSVRIERRSGRPDGSHAKSQTRHFHPKPV